MRSSFQMKQRRALAVDPGPDITPEAGRLPPVLATIGKEEGGLTTYPACDRCQFSICIEGQHGNTLGDALALNRPATVCSLCENTRGERSLPVESGEHFLTCPQFVFSTKPVGMDPL